MSILYEYDEKKQRRLDWEEGIEIGEETRLIAQVHKKISKNRSIEIIAEELETTVDDIKPIYEAVKDAPADADPMEIYLNL